MKLRSFFNDLDISNKLLIIIGVSSMAVVSISIVTLSGMSVWDARRDLEKKARVTAEVMAKNTIVALAFSDAKAAVDTLGSLSADDSIDAAGLYDQHGKLFASYVRDQNAVALTNSTPTGPDSQWDQNVLRVSIPVKDPGSDEAAARLVLWVNGLRVQETLRHATVVGGLLLVILGAVTFGLFHLLQGLISAPILKLVRAVEHIGRAGDYSVRVEKTSDDEVGRLIESFNSMIETIEASSAKLEQHSERLESEIGERTRDLRASEARIRAILESARDGILTVDATGQIRTMNGAAMRMFGYTSGFAHVLFDSLESEDGDRPERPTLMARAREASVAPTPVFQAELKGADDRRFLASISVGTIEEGETTGFTLIISDITNFRQAEEMLRRSRDEAFAASRAKSEFLANMSHEIRTPMNAIIGMSELCLDTPLTSIQMDYVSTVLDSAKALLDIINDILDFSKLESGMFRVDSAQFSVRDTVAATVRLFAPRFYGTDIEFVCDIAPSLAPLYRGDAGRIRQVLVNLLGNAAKFTHKGEVVLVVEDVSVESDEGVRQIRFTVRDTGIGIPEEKQAIVFDAFSQADASTTRMYGGTGLGLAISQQLARLMGGTIEVQSTVGIGSEFRFTVPLLSVEEEVLPVPPNRSEPQVAGLRVLVVEDHDGTRRVLSRTLSVELGLNVTAVESAHEALACLGESDALAAKFDLVISDFQMPVVNGLEFVRLMRRTPSAADVPVLLLSSVDLGFAATTLQSLGVSTTLMKPAFGSTLIAGVCSALGRTVTQGDKPGLPTQESLRSEGTQAEAHRLKVLVVEDNRVNQKLIKQLLVNRGHDVVVAENGEEALTILEETGALGAIAHHGASPVDVVLMDIQMPIMDGIEATSIIRQKEEGLGSHLPIIALTANAFDNQRQQYLEAGMDDYLPKPIDTSQLTALLKLYGEKKSAGEKMTITPPAPLS